ncbi:MAG: amidohydrolase family protein [Spirochaetes bacterium]|nr:amidohydrolase family protein [Spirochaetota bacterium]
MIIIDSHSHLFNSAVIDNVSGKKEMADLLKLQTEEASSRAGIDALILEINSSEIYCSIILPTANASSIEKTNSYFIEVSKSSEKIFTAGTLHPGCLNNKDELNRLYDTGIRGIKLCSFSQSFELNAPETITMFETIKDKNLEGHQFFVILDTFYNASDYFGTNPDHNTTPALLGNIVKNFPEIKFIAAHMGGLNAPFKEITDYLEPMENLYLDTSNAAHTLANSEFVRLLKQHGPEHIIFGTDWPWFSCRPEITLIDTMLKYAGYNDSQKQAVFSGNIAQLASIPVNE